MITAAPQHWSGTSLTLSGMRCFARLGRFWRRGTLICRIMARCQNSTIGCEVNYCLVDRTGFLIFVVPNPLKTTCGSHRQLLIGQANRQIKTFFTLLESATPGIRSFLLRRDTQRSARSAVRRSKFDQPLCNRKPPVLLCVPCKPLKKRIDTGFLSMVMTDART